MAGRYDLLMLTSEAAASRVFEPARRGYSKEEVEALRARIVVALTLSERGITEGVPVGADDLVRAELGFGRGGYDHRDVDRFLEQASAVLRRRGVLSATKEVEPGREGLTLEGIGRKRGGYDVDEVAAFIDDTLGVLEAWVTGAAPEHSATDLERRTFATRRRGLDPEGVERLVALAARLVAEQERRAED